MKALERIKVLDMTRLAPGPYGTMLLADLGADVVRIEEFGKRTGRRAGTSELFNEDRGIVPSNSAYNALNRNKRSIALNLKTESGRNIFYRLAEKADVVVEEFRPGTTKRLSVDYETLSEINPRIIYCAITGYGQNGPYRDLVGHDINYVAMSGALSLIGRRGDIPAIPHNFLADFAGGGMHAVIGILSALVARERTGRGQFVDVSMFDGVVSLMSMIMSYCLATGDAPERGEHLNNGVFPFYNVYETKDGKYIAVGCIEPWFWKNFCEGIGKKDLIPFQWDTGEKRQEIFETFERLFKTKTRDEWNQQLSESDTCVTKVQTIDEMLDDPQILHRKMVIEVDDPRKGKVRQIGSPFKLSETPVTAEGYTPAFAEHTEEVLLEAEFSMDEIENFREKGACN